MTTRYKNVQIYVNHKDHKELKKNLSKKTGYKSLSELHRDVERQVIELYKDNAFTDGFEKVMLLAAK